MRGRVDTDTYNYIINYTPHGTVLRERGQFDVCIILKPVLAMKDGCTGGEFGTDICKVDIMGTSCMKRRCAAETVDCITKMYSKSIRLSFFS